MTTAEMPTFGEQGRAFLRQAADAMHMRTDTYPAYAAQRNWAPMSLPPPPAQVEVIQDRPTLMRRALSRGRAVLRAANLFNRFRAAETTPLAAAMQTPTAVLKDPAPTLQDVPAAQPDTLVDQPVPRRLRTIAEPEPEYSSDPVEAKRQKVEWLYRNPPAEERSLASRIPPHMRRLGAFQEPEPTPQPENQGGDENTDTTPPKHDESNKLQTSEYPTLDLVPPQTDAFELMGVAERSGLFYNVHRLRSEASTMSAETVMDADMSTQPNPIAKLPVDTDPNFLGTGIFDQVTERLNVNWGTGDDDGVDAQIYHFPTFNTEEIPALYEGAVFEPNPDPDEELSMYNAVSRETGIFFPEGYSIFERTRQDLMEAEVLQDPDVTEFIENVNEPAITEPSSNPILDNFDKDAPFPHKLGIFDELSRKYQLFDHENPEEKRILEPIPPKIEKWDEVKYTDLAADYRTQFGFAVETASEAHLGGVLNNLLDSAAPFSADPLMVPTDLLSTPQKAAMGAVYSWTAAEFVENEAAKLGNDRAKQRAQEIRNGFTSEVYANIVNHALPRSFINRRSKGNDFGYVDATPQELTNLYTVSKQMRERNPQLKRGLADRKFGEIITALQNNIEAVPETMRAGVLIEYASRQAA